jgi:hypothetical protein
MGRDIMQHGHGLASISRFDGVNGYLFSSSTHAVSEAMDKINNKWGEFVITPALMMGMEDIILDRIAFGGVKELEEIYSE